jgi:membrane-associated phospholipid phosphatase
MLSRYWAIVLIALFSFNTITSQTTNNVDACPFCKQGEHLNKNPYRTGFKTELPFLISGIGLTSSGFILQSMNTSEPFSEGELKSLDRNDVNPFDRSATNNWNPNLATSSDYLVIGAMLLPAVFLNTHHTRSHLGSLIVMGVEVGLINYGITLSAKNLSNRIRPYVYNPEAPKEERTGKDSRASFFSAHTSNAAAFSFFFAKVMSDYHPNMKTELKIAMWTLAVAVPATTAYLRVESGKHFKTDVITGFIVGATTGWLVPHLHKKKDKKSAFSAFPTTIFGRPGMYLSYRF